MSVKIRKKKLLDGSTSLYLDVYHNGKRSYEFLDIRLTGRSAARTNNKEAMRLAEAHRSKREIELQSNQYGAVPSHKRRRNFLDFFADLAKTKHKSWRAVHQKLTEFSEGRVEFRQITPEWLEDFKKYLLNQVSPNSANLYYSKVVAALNIATQQGYIPKNPTASVRNVKKVPTMKNYLTTEDLRLLGKTPWAAADEKKAFLFGCYTGLRLCDIRGLQKSQVLPSLQLEIRQQKTKEPVYQPIPPIAYKMIQKNLEGPDGPLFVLPGSDGTLWTHLQHWFKKSGIKKKLSFGVSRHTFATSALTEGADIFAVSKLLGHTDIRHTQVYAKIVDETKRRVVNSLPEVEIID